MSAQDTRQQLLDFINKKLFDPIVKAKPEKYNEQDREILGDVQRKTASEQQNFADYPTADKIKKNYLSNVHSKAAAKVNDELRRLNLPTMPDHKDEFTELCNKLGV